MLAKQEWVWRELLVGAYELDTRRAGTVTALAGRLDMGTSTVHKALARPVEIGAVDVGARTGVRVLDPWRLLLLWATHRRLAGDVAATVPLQSSAAETEVLLSRRRGVILGGFGAVVAHEHGNLVAGYDTVLAYSTTPSVGALPTVRDGSPARCTLLVLEPDPLLSRYGRVTPLAQGYADLFNLPGWQAARFVSHLNARLLGDDAA